MALVVLSVAASFGQGTAFTYQGRLTDNGGPATGSYDLRLILYNSDVGGNQQGSILTNTAVAVNNGLFIASLDFGPGIFTGSNYWLEIAVRTNGGGTFSTLNPRQPVKPAPYAIMAGSAGNLLGSLPASQLTGAILATNLSGSYPNALILTNASNSFGGNGSNLTSLNASQLTFGIVPDSRIPFDIARRTGGNLFSGSQTFLDGSIGLGIIQTESILHVQNAGDTEISIESADTGSHRWTLQSSAVIGNLRDASFQIIDRTRNASRMLIDTNGNVAFGGLGGAAAKLHVNGPTLLQGNFNATAATTSNILNIASGLSTNGWSNGISFYETTGVPALSLGYDGTVAGSANNALRIYDTTAAPIFSFLNGGSFGIGTTAPATQLHIKDTSDTAVSLESADVGGHRWALQSTRINGTASTDASFQIIDRTAAASRILVDTNGNVGIHTTAPASTLHVNGTATVNGDVLHSFGGNFSRINPLAYGNVGSTGSVNAGTGNFSVSHTAGTGLYTITITGESYSFISYSAIITPIGLSAIIPATFSSSGSLQVRLFNASSTAVDQDFTFVVYRSGAN